MLTIKITKVLFIVLYINSTITLHCQDNLEPILSNKKEVKTIDIVQKKGELYLMVMPTLAYNPSCGFMFGAGSSASIFLGNPATTNISSGIASFNYTTKQQVLFLARSSIYTQNNNFALIGDWRFLSSSQPTFGLGTGPNSSKLAENGFKIDDNLYSKPIHKSQLLTFNQFRLHESVLKRINNNWFIGIGYHLDIFNSIKDELLDTLANPPILTSYFAYNLKNGIGQNKSSLSGVSANIIFDSRDNQNNAYKGQYAFIQLRANPTFLGSTKKSTSLWAEYRTFLNLTQNNRNMLCFWGFANIVLSGDLPYLNLPAIAEDQYARSGRGYSQGRFRGKKLIYLETEYRKHLIGSKKNPELIGMVVFLNSITASNTYAGINLFEYINLGAGLGLRIQISKESRSNIGLDYGWGNYKSSGFYIKINETF